MTCYTSDTHQLTDFDKNHRHFRKQEIKDLGLLLSANSVAQWSVQFTSIVQE